MIINMMDANINKTLSEIPVQIVNTCYESQSENMERLEKIEKSILNVNNAIEKNNQSIKLAQANIEEYKKIISKLEKRILESQLTLDQFSNSTLKTSKIIKEIKKLKECIKKYRENIDTYSQLIESREKLIKELNETNSKGQDTLNQLNIIKLNLK